MTAPEQRRLARVERERTYYRDQVVVRARQNRLDDALKRWAKPMDAPKEKVAMEPIDTDDLPHIA